MKEYSKYQLPVIEVYITDYKQLGLFVIMGDFITNKDAIYMYIYIVRIKSNDLKVRLQI